MAAEEKRIDAAAGECVGLLLGEEEAAAVELPLRELGAEALPLDLESLLNAIRTGSLSAAVIAYEQLTGTGFERVHHALSEQPRWTDLPVLLVVDRESLDGIGWLDNFGQLRIVERPLHSTLLKAVLRSAFRSRRHQREGRDFGDRALAAEDHFRQLTEALEASVAEQIDGLKALSARLATEIEDRKQIEQMLRESEDLYRNTVELSGQIVWTSDADGSNTVVGERFYELTGTDPARRFEDHLPDIVHPDDTSLATELWEQARATGTFAPVTFRMRVADGSYHIFEARAVLRRDEDGKGVRWYGFVEDKTEQRQMMEALREAEERYRLAARATNDAIWDWNVQTGHVAWSDAAAAYLGNLPVGDSSAEWWEQSIHPDDRERVMRSIRAALQGDKSRWSAAYRMRKADGDYAYVYDRGFIIRDDEGQAVRAVGAVVDLTERRRAEAELRRTQAELIHVSRVSAMGAMASTLAHELNQPLTAVTSYVRGSRRLLSNMKDPAVQQICEALEFAEAGALRAGQIVRRLRELVARGTVAVGPEDLWKLIDDASVLAFVDEHLHGVSHHIEVEPDARWVEVDRIQIQQVLINLIRNAVQAMQYSDQREVVISARSHGEDMVEVTVADTGSGIPDSVRDALFSPFHSTKSEGLGIGLSISRTIVEAHHGRIWAEDGPTGGAEFHFTLPKVDVPMEQELLELADLGSRSNQSV